MPRIALLLVILAVIAALPARGASGDSNDAPRTYNVVLVAPGSAADFARSHGIRPRHTVSSVFAGFSADLTPAQAQRLANDPAVRGVAPARPITADGVAAILTGYPPALPAGVDRVDAEFAPIVDDAGVAVLDSGIDLARPEFNVKVAMSFIAGTPSAQDDFGHGTHVAGIAVGNAMHTGFRGVAPRAPLAALKVLDSTGNGQDSDAIAAIDWLAANGPAMGIRVANMSFKADGTDTPNCGVSGPNVVDPWHYAICQAVEAGIIFTAAAGNGAADASNGIPSAYPEVVTVSNIRDNDGAGGASSPPDDDTFYTSSDFGASVDIAAPGTAILSTVPTGSCVFCAPTGYTYLTGTSMSAPAVAGALATYIAQHPGSSTVGSPGTLAAAAQALIQQSKPQSDHCGFSGDPDAYPEPMLYVGIPDSDCGAIATPDSDGDGLPDIVETQIYGSSPAVGDTDGDGCRDGAEAGGEPLFGGLRDPLNPWDFFDVPTPVLTPANATGTRNHAISIQDVIAIVYYIGTKQGGGPNASGVSYDSDRDADGVADGREYDRSASTTAGEPWRSGPPSGAVSIQDALVALQQVGTTC